MTHLLRASALLVMLGLLAWTGTTVNAGPKEGDWEGGWNTWDKAAAGDWAEYTMTSGMKIRQDIVEVSGKNVTYKHAMYDKAGKELSSKDRTKEWSSIKIQARLPYKVEVQWEEGDYELGERTIKCDIAKWVVGETASEAWYSTEVPCGGVVKQVTGGNDIVWLTSFDATGLQSGGGEAGGDVESELPKFYATKGNYAVYEIKEGGDKSYVRHEVTEVTATATKWTSVACSEVGTPEEDAKVTEHELTKADWDASYASPKKKDQKMKGGGVEYACDMFESKEDGVTTKEWISDGLVVVKMVTGGGSNTFWQLELAVVE